jgi:excisionase family DNA binding protein
MDASFQPEIDRLFIRHMSYNIVMKEEWLTIRQATQRTGVHRDTIHRWIRAGLIRARKEVGIVQTLVHADDLAAIMANPPRRGPRPGIDHKS